MNVSWEAPQFPNGILEGYRLVYEPCTPVDGEWDPSACLTPTSRGLSLSRRPLAVTAVHVASISQLIKRKLRPGQGKGVLR